MVKFEIETKFSKKDYSIKGYTLIIRESEHGTRLFDVSSDELEQLKHEIENSGKHDW